MSYRFVHTCLKPGVKVHIYFQVFSGCRSVPAHIQKPHGDCRLDLTHTKKQCSGENLKSHLAPGCLLLGQPCLESQTACPQSPPLSHKLQTGRKPLKSLLLATSKVNELRLGCCRWAPVTESSFHAESHLLSSGSRVGFRPSSIPDLCSRLCLFHMGIFLACTVCSAENVFSVHCGPTF